MFEWTWRRTLTGLGIAGLLTVLALAFDAWLDGQAEQIRTYGDPVTAHVVDVRPGFAGIRYAVVDFTAYGSWHRVEISDVYGTAPPVGSEVKLHTDSSFPERVAGRDSLSSLPDRAAPRYLGILAAVVALVCLGGRMVATATAGYAQRRRVRRPRVWWGRRGVVRRDDGFSRTLMALGLVGLVLIPLGASPLPVVSVCAPIIAAGYLMGFARKVAVTSTDLVVYNAFSITWIPRHLAVEVGLKQRESARLRALLEDIQEEPNTGAPSVMRRWTAAIALGTSLVPMVLQVVQQQ